MEKRTERQQLVDRFQRMKAEDGLLDMKFFFGPVSETTVDGFCEEVNRMYRFVEEGKYTEVTEWGDRVTVPDST